MTTLLGIDEAGRGPVIGPMVLAGVAISDQDQSFLEEQAFDDSKKMSASAREEQRTLLEEEGRFDLYSEVIPAKEIDQTSLTELTLQRMTQLIEAAGPDRVIFDAPGHPSSIDAFQQRLTKRLNLSAAPALHAEPGADDTYPIVSAASIIAKTDRDRRIEALQEQFGDLGSGYPSDPNTKEFLRNHLSPDEDVRKHIRTRWKTFQDLVSAAGGPLFAEQTTENAENHRE